MCVGRLCEQKGQLLLVQAAQRLRQRGLSFELVLAGDGEMRAEVQAAIAAASSPNAASDAPGLQKQPPRSATPASRARASTAA